MKNYLRDKRMLLVLDNFEHVTEAAGVVSELLAAAPELGIVVTSRAVLRLYGEQEYPLAPLPLPDPARLPPLADLARSPAVALFVDRAQGGRCPISSDRRKTRPPWPRSASGSMACRWRSSWRPPGPGSSRRKRCSTGWGAACPS